MKLEIKLSLTRADISAVLTTYLRASYNIGAHDQVLELWATTDLDCETGARYELTQWVKRYGTTGQPATIHNPQLRPDQLRKIDQIVRDKFPTD